LDRLSAANRLPAGRAKRVNPPHRHIQDESSYESTGFSLYSPAGDENPRPGFDNWRSQLDRLRAQRTGCPQGERSESIPLTAIFKMKARTKVRAFSLYSPAGG
jgi:hypothetical protein